MTGVVNVVSQFDDYELIGKISLVASKQIALEEGCALNIAATGVTIIHKARQEIVNVDRPSDIAFATVIKQNSKEYEGFAYISQNIKLNLRRCHVFTVLQGAGALIIQALEHAKSEYVVRIQQDMKNPFAAHKNAPREIPKGNLFTKQIHRADLQALEVLGSGQFGAVYLASQKMRQCPITGKLFAIDGHLKQYLDRYLKKNPEKKLPEGWDMTKVQKVDVIRVRTFQLSLRSYKTRR